MNYSKLSFSLMLLLFFALPAFSQKQKINGKVTDAATGAPLAGATIKVRSSGTIAVAKKDGSFSVETNTTDVLETSSIGYGLQLVNINSTEDVTIQLSGAIQDLSQIVMLGSRRPGRIKTDSPVPVDVINLSQVNLSTARPDLTSLLNYAAPSFNYNKQSGSDGADQIDLATLRGLGPDQTLVLINGKRRHQTAFVAVFGTRGRGNSGTDLNAIPEASIDRVEILRDGASAQYGSDAIAGVINLILKKDINKINVTAGYSGYYDKKYNPYFKRDQQQYVYGSKIDGKTFSFGIDGGTSLGKNKGFIHVAGNFLMQDKTFRQVLDNDLSHKDGLPVNGVRRANGDGSTKGGGVMFNLEAPIANTSATFYAFGGLNYKDGDAFAYTRVNSVDDEGKPTNHRFPTVANGTIRFDKSIMRLVPLEGGGFDTTYNPHILTNITDGSGAMGIKGTTNSSWDWDLSNTFGGNNFHYFGNKTYNASLGAGTGAIRKNRFNDGGFYTQQNTTNLDLSKRFSTVAQGLDLGLGAEFRWEEYGIYKGEDASWANYDPARIKASGSQGFPGFQPVDQVSANRTNIGGYIDAELDVTKEWLVGAAVRVENYNDFGFVNTFKLATRYKIGSNFNLRGSVSTGFRAPSLQQINFSNTFTNVEGGHIFDVKIAPNSSPITKAAGIPELKQEKSVNASLGFTWKPTNELTIGVDGYYVQIKDRVVLSGTFDTSTALKPVLEELGVLKAQFFANAVNTTNTGVDLVVDYTKKWGKNSFKAIFAGNFQNMKIDKVNVPKTLDDNDDNRQNFFSEREKKFVLASAPPVKLGLTLDYSQGCLGIGTHLTYFGKIELLGYSNGTVPADDGSGDVAEQFNYNGKLVTDLYFSVKFCNSAILYFGADNLFNVHPDLGYAKGAKLQAFDGETGGPWDPVQVGNNGIRAFAKLALTFK